ncbi:MAG: acyl-ACP--UDP-N-acetylglucosamine O-acyltransferase [Bacteroidota bacterium]
MKQPLANIHPDARIGDNVVLEPFCTVQGDVEIGEGTWIGPNAVIMDGARIGKNCRIFPGAVISAIPQDLKFAGEKTTVEIGDNTTIREYATVNRGTKDKFTTKIGSNCLIMAYVQVAHDCIIGNHCVLANNVTLAGHITIHDWATLEGWVGVQQFVSIGQHAFISGGSGVRKDVPPFVKAARSPLAYIGVNIIGLKRRGFSEESIAQIEDIYRTLLVHNSNLSNGLEAVETDLPDSPERTLVMDFVKNSQNGILRGPHTAANVADLDAFRTEG